VNVGFFTGTLLSPVRQAAGQVADPSAASQAAADSTDEAIRALGENVTDAGRLLARGEWDAFGQQLLDGFLGLLASFTPRALSALFVALVFYAGYRALLHVVGRVLRRSSRVGRGMETLLMRSLRVLGLVFVAVMALSQLGVNVSALVAGVGIAGLAVGFAAKDSLENFISGVTILLDRPFRVGDWVQVEDTYGEVSELTLRSTRIRTLNREEVVFPNLHMVTNAVVNHSTRTTLRVDIPFGVAYKEDLDETRAVIEPLAEGDARVASRPAPRVVVTELGDSSVNLEYHVHLQDPADQIPVRFDYVEKVRKALGEADIEIPFPHLQLFIDEAEGLRDLSLVVDGSRSETGPHAEDGPERASSAAGADQAPSAT
jgi:small conductance mechanosensitive channel